MIIFGRLQDKDSLMDCQKPKKSQKEGQEDQGTLKRPGGSASSFTFSWSS